MRTLLLTQSTISPNKYRVELAFEGGGSPRQTATAEFEFSFTLQDRESLRWYLEDYLQHAADPAPQIAARIEGRIAEIGNQLFQQVFGSSKTAERLWARLQENLNETRIEIVAEVQEATAIPWELLRDPLTETHLALEAKAFVRSQTDMTRTFKLPQLNAVKDNTVEPIRILLVICRPGGSDDVPFRSVASRLIKGLSESARETYQLDVLRPPTFEQFGKVLRYAKIQGKPYHIVHFDGHGMYTEAKREGGLTAMLRNLGSLMLSAPRTGTHGYLLFENPSIDGNAQLIDGVALGKLLTETDVSMLVLNACRSAHAEAPATPETTSEQASLVITEQLNSPHPDTQMQVRAFGSLAQEVVNAGVGGVVAMRYNVYVVTAAQFVADLYASLANGQTLGEAVTLGRKQLETQSLREIAYHPRPLQDWMVPIVYEAAPVALFPKPVKQADLHITLANSITAPTKDNLANELTKRPDAGFFGRDETLLALDRAFDTQSIVLLHAYAGSGKTSTAAEFARWYHLTGGINGPVLFTSFERHKPLAQVLNETIGRIFSDPLEHSGIHWLALSDEQRREVALQVLAQIPVLWVWDNIEPIAGFPVGVQSVWSNGEQQEIADFLRASQQTKAKILLISRRDEQGWLGDLPVRIQVPPMPMLERVQLARALAEKQRRRLTDVEDWIPLLRFTAGNPLTITVLIGQALRDGLKTKEQVEAFVDRLRTGETAFEDEATEGRTKSLGASISYGFEHTFSEVELKQLALLYLFQDTVYVVVLRTMGEPDNDWCVPEVRGLSRETAINLLDRAAEVGILTSIGGGHYTIHPALPWFLKNFFDRYYLQKTLFSETSTDSLITRSQQSPTYAYVAAVSRLASVYRSIYQDGDWRMVMPLSCEEQNLLHALKFAKSNRWHDLIIDLMHGFHVLYNYEGRGIEWKKLVLEILPYFIDEQMGMSKPDLEESWKTVIQWRAEIAIKEKDFKNAEEAYNLLLAVTKNEATAALDKSKDEWTENDRHAISNLAITLGNFGILKFEALDKSCIGLLNDAFDFEIQLDDKDNAAANAFHIGHAYFSIVEIKDLDKAESWYQKSLELMSKDDTLKYAMRLHELGQICYARFIEAVLSDKQNLDVLNDLINKAAGFCYKALTVLPDSATRELKHIHSLLGNIYDDAGDPKKALEHYRIAIRLSEDRGELDVAAKVCREIARCLLKTNQLDDALDYAKESLRKLQNLGSGSSNDLETSQKLILAIQYMMQQK